MRSNNLDRTRRVMRIREIVLAIAGAILFVAMETVGIVAASGMSETIRHRMMILLIAGMVLPWILAVGNPVILHLIQNPYDDMNVEEYQRWMLSLRKDPAKIVAQKHRKLARIRRGTTVYTLVLFLVVLLDAFLLGGYAYDHENALPDVLSVLGVTYLIGILMRVRFRLPGSVFEDSGYVSESEYPELYALTRKAARACGFDEEIHIDLRPDSNAGIAKITGAYSVQLGVIMLGMMNQEELYHILLHEFAHMRNRTDQKEWDYYNWLEADDDYHEVVIGGIIFLTTFMFVFPDNLYTFEFDQYRMAASLDEEVRADRAMAEMGNAEIAASSLLKLKYEALYDWEDAGRNGDRFPDTLAQHQQRMISGHIEAMRCFFRERNEFYNSLIRAEILPDLDSHPTVNMRLSTLGVSGLRLVDLTRTEAYESDVAKAIQHVERRLLEDHSEEEYLEERKELLRVLERWEGEGKPLDTVEYPDVVDALLEMGRVDEAIALCDRALEELPEGSSEIHALYMKGCHLLHHWDERGIDMIYQAMEENTNYVEEGIEEIGEFCCITGNQKEYDRFRKKKLEILQRTNDLEEQMGFLSRGDELRGETLPNALKEHLLHEISLIDHGQIQNLYLIRKTFSSESTKESFFSAMIVKLNDTVSLEEEEETMHQLFLCLDGIRDWQFSLYEYDDVSNVRPEKIPGSLFYTNVGLDE